MNTMKKSKIAALIMALAVLAVSAFAVSAKELTNTNQDGSSEVYANIKGDGEVSYVVEIPDSVDFGTLTQPDTDTDSYVYQNFDVTLTSVSGLQSNQRVSVWVKDSNSSLGVDENFYLTQQNPAEGLDAFKMTYDVYGEEVNDGNIAEKTAINSGEMGENGYMFGMFKDVNDTMHSTLVLNQKQLYGENLNDLAGDYTGTMTFHSEVTNTILP